MTFDKKAGNHEQKPSIPAAAPTVSAQQQAIIRPKDVDRSFGLILFLAVAAIAACAWALGGFQGRPDTDEAPDRASSSGTSAGK